MHSFVYRRPGTLGEAVAALDGAEEAKVLGGGQSLIPLLKLNLAATGALIAIGKLPELRGIRTQDTGGGKRLVIGAAMTHAEVSESAQVLDSIPALAALAHGIGDPQVRNRGTLGGSIAHNDPAADYPAALVALDAAVVTTQRTIAAEELFTGMFETALMPGEIIKEVSFAVPTRAAYAKFPNPASRFAVVGVMVAQHSSGVRVAVVGAGTNVFRVAEMEKRLHQRFQPDALDGVEVPAGDLAADMHASAEYRAHLITVMARRAVAACAA